MDPPTASHMLLCMLKASDERTDGGGYGRRPAAKNEMMDIAF
jgi:hypothetical protein